mmetsp:Transcript_400/g.895  ORF Transcript_400/g.895 Transcript_400/m.895 type:complete len:303 (+) Transcript_400:386-1294(+)
MTPLGADLDGRQPTAQGIQPCATSHVPASWVELPSFFRSSSACRFRAASSAPSASASGLALGCPLPSAAGVILSMAMARWPRERGSARAAKACTSCFQVERTSAPGRSAWGAPASACAGNAAENALSSCTSWAPRPRLSSQSAGRVSDDSPPEPAWRGRPLLRRLLAMLPDMSPSSSVASWAWVCAAGQSRACMAPHASCTTASSTSVGRCCHSRDSASNSSARSMEAGSASGPVLPVGRNITLSRGRASSSAAGAGTESFSSVSTLFRCCLKVPGAGLPPAAEPSASCSRLAVRRIRNNSW